MAFGLLEDVAIDRFASTPSEPVRPGTAHAETMAGSGKSASQDLDPDTAWERVETRLRYQMDKARIRAELAPSATTYAKFAQAELDAGLAEDSVRSATRALELCASEAVGGFVDVVSVHVAAEVLQLVGQSETALELLSELPETPALELVRATLEAEAGHVDSALSRLMELEGPLVRSQAGYLLIQLGRYHEAILQLRAALREYPNDPDAAMNLALALWAMGGRRKALRFALRAVRSAPGRRDLSLRYLDLMLDFGDAKGAHAEIRRVRSQGVVADAQFLIIEARTALALGFQTRALPLLDRALEACRREQDSVAEGEVAANRIALRFDLGKTDRPDAWQQLAALMEQFPDNDAVLLNLAYLSRRVSERTALARGFERVKNDLPPERRAYTELRLAYLNGDADATAAASARWLDLAPADSNAAAEFVQFVGIGLGRWEEAADVASRALSSGGAANNGLVNNAAYVLAMAGTPGDAIAVLEASSVDSYALKATLGLAYMASGDVEAGMRLYRRAAEMADGVDRSGALRSLMTVYQALIVRQLGLLSRGNLAVIRAAALPSVPLPSDWSDRPEFLFVKAIAARNGYPWPLELP